MIDLTKYDEEDEVDSPNPINPMGKKVKVSSEEVARSENDKGNKDEEMDKVEAVSYTHLTLPTILLV